MRKSYAYGDIAVAEAVYSALCDAYMACVEAGNYDLDRPILLALSGRVDDALAERTNIMEAIAAGTAGTAPGREK